MSSFGTVDFKVFARDGYFPTPSPDREGVERWSATIQLETKTDFDELAAYVSDVNVSLAVGAYVGWVKVDKGPGSAVLEAPWGKGLYFDKNAILTSISGRGSGTTEGRYTADVEFICLGDAG